MISWDSNRFNFEKRCWILKIFKGCLSILGIFVVLLIIFFTWNSYTSPVNEAGRDYKKVIKSYEGTEIQSMDDVFERMDVLEKHYNSPVFSKMQGGDKVEVTPEDMETLFGVPDNVITGVDVPFMDTVNQYYYDDFILNFHQDGDSIEAFVREDYSGVLYEEPELTELYFDFINRHLSEGIPNSEKGEMLLIDEMWTLIGDNIPTREVYESGWDTGFQNQRFYFDDGQGKNAPAEYLNLELQAEGDTTELQFMERRFNEPFLTLDTKEEAKAKQEAYLKYKEFVRAKNYEESSAPIYFRELAEDFGDIAKLHYRFRNSEVWVSWLILPEDGEATEIRGEVRLTEETIPENITDIMNLEIRAVNKFDVNNPNVEDFRVTADFIGQ